MREEMCHVVELSSESLLVFQAPNIPLPIGEIVRGELRFIDATTMPVEGTVSRRDGNNVVIRLTQPLSQDRYHQELSIVGNWNERRRYFRLSYPLHEMPTIEVDGVVYRLIEISEHGVVIYVTDKPFHIGQSVSGQLTLHGNEAVNVSGSILRYNNDGAILYLPVGIPSNQIVKEQLRMIRLYKSK